MKLYVLAFLLISVVPGMLAQGVFKATSGNIRFYSKAPLEDIEAFSTIANSALNLNTKEVAVLLKINSFKFDNALMQEHFNENYMESDKFPTATFQGKIKDDLQVVPGTTQQVSATGELTIHGVAKPYTIPVHLRYVKDGTIQATSEFFVSVADHGIKIPQIVFNNIAEKVEVTIDFKYTKVK